MTALHLPPDLLAFVGRFHPVLVHLPIGFVVLLAALEVLGLSTRLQRATGSAGYILALAVPVTLAAAACGWLLSRSGGYDGHLLQRHQWTGIATAAACALTALLYRHGWKTLYRLGLFGTLALLTVASHLGGSLTHGKDYLTQHAPMPLRTWLGGTPLAAPAEVRPVGSQDKEVFADAVRPIFDKYCVACHGPEKAKGGLRCDSLAELLKGGKAGAAVVPAKPAESELIKRLRLPLGDDDHMPPAGKPQPTADDLALLAWWIEAGAPGDKKVGELAPPPAIQAILKGRFGEPGAAATP